MTDRLVQLLAEPSQWTYAYIDGPGDEPAGAADDVPRGAEHGRIRSIRDRLDDIGAPNADIEAITDVLAAGTGVPSPSARYLLVRDGRIELDESFSGARLGPERVGHAAVPVVLPLLRHRGADVRYLVVEVDREGADLRLERAARAGAELTQELEGEYDDVQKVRAGDLSQARIQRSAEEMWSRNLDEAADEVDRLVRDRRPAFVALAGDIRARQLLREKLAPATVELVIEVDANTRAEGSDSAALDAAIEQAVHDHRRSAVDAIRDRAAADQGSGGAFGTLDVVAALQQAQVDTLLLDALAANSDDTLIALDAAPWVVESLDDSLGATSLGAVSAPEALARAALLSGATVLIEEDDEPAPDAPRDDRDPRAPRASLRW